MATRKTNNDPRAAIAAKDLILAHSNSISIPPEVVDLFPVTEFETATSKVGGETVSLRRVVLTGPWEVVTSDQ